ncbi:MAG: hypothetical protein JWM25_1159 [Thermoleophilia bacterium]|nr:hypothetical protein [Thermoleophilia bacterium]MCZ4496576.1 hypothetical protein [Thermoleophilia bacterium]
MAADTESVARPALLSPVHADRRIPRIDPVLAIVAGVLCAVMAWVAAPLATGAAAPVSSDTRVEVEVPNATSVTPGWQAGQTAVRLPNLSIPGDSQDVTSDGWRLAANWANGYEIRIASTTSPALRGANAVDGEGAPDTFADYSTGAACPCAWSSQGAKKGMFGYSVSVESSSGPVADDTAKWGDARSRKWRGFTKSSYRAFSTQGGTGEYTMALHLRTMIPDGAVQREGSYRAGLVISAHPLL